MTAVNAGIHELAGVRLPLQPYSGGHAVFMYSTATDGNVTLQLKEPDDLDRRSLAAMLARLQDDATFSISYQDTDILSDGSIDVLLGTGSNNSLQDAGGNESATTTFDLFDSSSGPDLTLSPQTFTNSAEAFINDNSNSLGVPADNDPVSSTDDKKVQGTTGEIVKLAVKRVRPKAASPNRQGPQQCQVCAKVFGNASALAKHKLTHSDERKYVCTICGKAFKRQDHLNGHMLTHRNKKPYECKAEGCGKSYCDARSLRRHTENHHNTCVNATTMSPAQGAASGDAASPHGASCIQYAPPPNNTTSGKSQLQQLLASEPAKSLNGDNNDGLTKQQLDLIHQIMEQTQRQSQTTTTTKSTKQSSKPASKAPVRVQKVWSSTSQQINSQKTTGSPTNLQIKVSSTSSPTNTNKSEPKPVECNLCHRKFKNIPALNGHMRLHGGYFKKDSDNKKNEKKDAAGPPLQTASVSVRALIEEKIINKRITNPNNTASSDDSNQKSAPPLFPLTNNSSTSNELESKVTSFVVPAPPQQIAEKSRRHSDTETFTIPRPPTAQETENLDLILKREKVFKRTTSDPGQNSPIIQFQTGSSFSLTYQSDDGEFISPNLQEEVFTQDGMLLQTVNNSLHFKSENLLQDKTDNQLQDINLHDYSNLHDGVGQSPSYQSTHSVNQDLQAVLDSPLPDTLAEFSAYHSSGNLDIPSPSYQNQSPAQYSSSPHASLTAQSPLQSPLIRHDSPGFAYPTPPASHEGQSPCFGQNTMLPMVSPKQNDFTQIIERDSEEPPQASSPLSAAFFTSTMSSSAAVEEALEEVLPGENIGNDELYSSLANSPSPHSPLSVGLTPVASPLSNIPNSTPSPLPQNNCQTAQNTISFPMTQHYTLQTHMLPNSDDPLLSSSSKDFSTRRKFEFNGVPLKIISTGEQIDLNNTNLTGILVESNGEIKFIHTGNNFQGKNIYLTGAPLMTTQRESNINNNQNKHEVVQIKQNIQIQRPKDSVDNTKPEEILHDVFVSPTIIPTASNPVRPSRKRPRTEPLQFPVLHQSRLRSTRSKPQGATSYTPFPILNPNRSGSGLFVNLKQKSADNGDDFINSWSNESIPETDSTPHVNIGQQFQCNIPPLNKGQNRFTQEKQHENLLWDPGILQCTDNEVEMYLEFACCAAIPGGGRNQEYALHLLHMCNGNIQDAMLKLMLPTPLLPADHPLLGYTYSESDNWNATETEIFNHAIQKYDKDFTLIAQEVGTKNKKQCVQFYYMWKKVCVEEYKLLKHVREKNQEQKMDLVEEKLYPDAKLLGIVDVGSPMPNQEQRNFICEFLDCSASFNSRAALNGHIRIHGGNTRNSPTPAHTMDGRLSSIITTPCHTDSSEDYPCKICGKVFSKIKSRSAHMKSHRPQDAEPIRKKEKEMVTSTMVDPSPTSFNT